MVAPLVGAAAISAISSLAAGLLGRSGAKKARKIARHDAANAVQMRTADALKAGIHPIYAMGANINTAPPINVGEPLATGISDMGQNIGRAMTATSSDGTRSAAYTKLALENMGLQNDLLRSQIGRINSAQIGPGLPAPGDLIPEVPSSGRPFLRGGGRIATDPTMSSAQDFENRYGEMSDFLAGPVIAYKDLKETLRQGSSKQDWISDRLRSRAVEWLLWKFGVRR